MEHDAILGVIDRVYEAAAAREGWAPVLDDLANLAGAQSASLVLAFPALGLTDVIAPRSDPDVISDFKTHWYRKDVTQRATFSARVGQITSLEDTGRERFLGSEFHNEFWRLSGHSAERLAANLYLDHGALASVGVHPDPRGNDIGPDLAAVFSAMVPHLVRAVSIQCQLRRLEMERDLARMTPGRTLSGYVLLDARGRVILADDAAQRLLAADRGLRLEQGEIAAATPAETARLRALVASCSSDVSAVLRGGRMSLSGPGRGAQLEVEVVPGAAAAPSGDPAKFLLPAPVATLLVRDPAAARSAATQLLRARYGLTPAEARVALELTQGDGRAAVAQRLGVSLATVRTHMMRIFDKTGVNRQAALIQLLAKALLEQDLF